MRINRQPQTHPRAYSLRPFFLTHLGVMSDGPLGWVSLQDFLIHGYPKKVLLWSLPWVIVESGSSSLLVLLPLCVSRFLLTPHVPRFVSDVPVRATHCTERSDLLTARAATPTGRRMRCKHGLHRSAPAASTPKPCTFKKLPLTTFAKCIYGICTFNSLFRYTGHIDARCRGTATV